MPRPAVSCHQRQHLGARSSYQDEETSPGSPGDLSDTAELSETAPALPPPPPTERRDAAVGTALHS